MPSYVTTIKADAWRCEPDPCGGQRTTGRSSSCLRDVDSLRHEIFHQTKARVKGLSQGERTLLHTASPKENTLGPCWPSKGKVNYRFGLRWCNRSLNQQTEHIRKRALFHHQVRLLSEEEIPINLFKSMFFNMKLRWQTDISQEKRLC